MSSAEVFAECISRGLRRVVRLLLVGTAASLSQRLWTPANHSSPVLTIAQVLGVVVVQVYELHEPTPPPVAIVLPWACADVAPMLQTIINHSDTHEYAPAPIVEPRRTRL